MTFEEAISLLKIAVKDSHLKNQPHIDLTLIKAEDRPRYEKALMVINSKVLKGEMKREELRGLLGL